MKFFIKDFFTKCTQIPRELRICSYLLKKFPTENFTGVEAYLGPCQTSMMNVNCHKKLCHRYLTGS